MYTPSLYAKGTRMGIFQGGYIWSICWFNKSELFLCSVGVHCLSPRPVVNSRLLIGTTMMPWSLYSWDWPAILFLSSHAICKHLLRILCTPRVGFCHHFQSEYREHKMGKIDGNNTTRCSSSTIAAILAAVVNLTTGNSHEHSPSSMWNSFVTHEYEGACVHSQTWHTTATCSKLSQFQMGFFLAVYRHVGPN